MNPPTSSYELFRKGIEDRARALRAEVESKFAHGRSGEMRVALDQASAAMSAQPRSTLGGSMTAPPSTATVIGSPQSSLDEKDPYKVLDSVRIESEFRRRYEESQPKWKAEIGKELFEFARRDTISQLHDAGIQGFTSEDREDGTTEVVPTDPKLKEFIDLRADAWSRGDQRSLAALKWSKYNEDAFTKGDAMRYGLAYNFITGSEQMAGSVSAGVYNYFAGNPRNLTAIGGPDDFRPLRDPPPQVIPQYLRGKTPQQQEDILVSMEREVESGTEAARQFGYGFTENIIDRMFGGSMNLPISAGVRGPDAEAPRDERLTKGRAGGGVLVKGAEMTGSAMASIPWSLPSLGAAYVTKNPAPAALLITPFFFSARDSSIQDRLAIWKDQSDSAKMMGLPSPARPTMAELSRQGDLAGVMEGSSEYMFTPFQIGILKGAGWANKALRIPNIAPKAIKETIEETSKSMVRDRGPIGAIKKTARAGWTLAKVSGVEAVEEAIPPAGQEIIDQIWIPKGYESNFFSEQTAEAMGIGAVSAGLMFAPAIAGQSAAKAQRNREFGKNVEKLQKEGVVGAMTSAMTAKADRLNTSSVIDNASYSRSESMALHHLDEAMVGRRSAVLIPQADADRAYTPTVRQAFEQNGLVPIGVVGLSKDNANATATVYAHPSRKAEVQEAMRNGDVKGLFGRNGLVEPNLPAAGAYVVRNKAGQIVDIVPYTDKAEAEAEYGSLFHDSVTASHEIKPVDAASLPALEREMQQQIEAQAVASGAVPSGPRQMNEVQRKRGISTLKYDIRRSALGSKSGMNGQPAKADAPFTSNLLTKEQIGDATNADVEVDVVISEVSDTALGESERMLAPVAGFKPTVLDAKVVFSIKGRDGKVRKVEVATENDGAYISQTSPDGVFLIRDAAGNAFTRRNAFVLLMHELRHMGVAQSRAAAELMGHLLYLDLPFALRGGAQYMMAANPENLTDGNGNMLTEEEVIANYAAQYDAALAVLGDTKGLSDAKRTMADQNATEEQKAAAQDRLRSQQEALAARGAFETLAEESVAQTQTEGLGQVAQSAAEWQTIFRNRREMSLRAFKGWLSYHLGKRGFSGPQARQAIFEIDQRMSGKLNDEMTVFDQQRRETSKKYQEDLRRYYEEQERKASQAQEDAAAPDGAVEQPSQADRGMAGGASFSRRAPVGGLTKTSATPVEPPDEERAKAMQDAAATLEDAVGALRSSAEPTPSMLADAVGAIARAIPLLTQGLASIQTGGQATTGRRSRQTVPPPPSAQAPSQAGQEPQPAPQAAQGTESLDRMTMPPSDGVMSSRRTLRGEWWLTESGPLFADGDTGDMNHEMLAQEEAIRDLRNDLIRYAPQSSDAELKGRIADFDARLDDMLDDGIDLNEAQSMARSILGDTENYVEVMDRLGVPQEDRAQFVKEAEAATGAVDPREYGLGKGWVRVQRNNIQLRGITDSALRKVADNLYQAEGEDVLFQLFTIEDVATRRVFEDVPFEALEKGISGLAPYRAQYSLRPIKRSEMTPEMATWSEGSKVVDENGDLIVVYHGTSKDKNFDKFKIGKRGAWFTTDPEDASMYAMQNDSMDYKMEPTETDPFAMRKTNTASRVIPAVLNLKNPANFERDVSAEDRQVLRMSENYAREQGRVFDQLRRQGFDGVNMGGGVWVAFEQNQIKGAFNERPTSSPKIMGSRRTPADRRLSSQQEGTPNERQPIADDRDRGGGREVRSLAPLEGAPTVRGATGPDPSLVAVAERYARSIGIDLKRQSEYAVVDEQRARRIAAAYEAMPHAPQDARVKEAYENLIAQTMAQYRALEADGYKFWFFDENTDPYEGKPWLAMRDLRANKSMAVYSTAAGFGTSDFDPSTNPLLVDTGLQWPNGSPDGPLVRVLANDLFRAVHDAFGHGIEGAGFRAQGEENAWQAHVRLFTGTAIHALTSETRGQNSWLNFGPFGKENQNAAVQDTKFADQKTGLMPEWTWTEGRVGDAAYSKRKSTGGPIEAAKTRVATMQRVAFKDSETFFKQAFPDMLRRTRMQLKPDSKNFREAARRAVSDVASWIKDNQRFSDYYETDWKATRDFLDDHYGRPITDEEIRVARFLAGVTSPNTGLPANVADMVMLTDHWIKNGNFDAFKFGANQYGNPKGVEGPYTISGNSAPNKLKVIKAVEMVARELGSWDAALKYMMETDTIKNVSAKKQTLGYKGGVGKVGIVRRVVKTASGTDSVVPRMFMFGPKVGAYTMNALGDSRYTTVDIWESRFIRAYFKGMFEENTGLPVDDSEHDLFVRFGEIFNEEWKKATGIDMEPSGLQASRWFYIIDATKRLGYSKASTNETISNYTERVLQERLGYRGTSQEGGRRGDGAAKAGAPVGQAASEPAARGTGRVDPQIAASSIDPVSGEITVPAMFSMRRGIAGAADAAAMQFLDRYDELLRMQRTTERRTGNNLAEVANPYSQARRLQGLLGAEQQAAERRYADLLYRQHRAGISHEDMDQFLYAQHAEERNNYIASIDPTRPDGGSGMTTGDAANFLNQQRRRGRYAEMNQFAEEWRGMLRDALDQRLAEGLIRQEVYDAVNSQYKNYVPLRGIAARDPWDADFDEVGGNFGRGMSTTGRGMPRATGRRSAATGVTSQVGYVHEDTFRRIERNRVGNRFLNLTRALRDRAWAEVVRPTRRVVVNGEVRVVHDQTWTDDGRHFGLYLTVPQRIGGHDYEQGDLVVIRINNARLAQAMLEPSMTLRTWERAMRHANNVWRLMTTGPLNPVFAPLNMIRDVQTAAANNWLMNGFMDTAAMLRRWPSAFRRIMRDEWLGNRVPTGTYADFVRDGGQQMYWRDNDLEVKRTDFEALAQRVARRDPNDRTLARTLFGWYTAFFTAAETASRLAYYEQRVASGENPQQAALGARDITVDFEKGGLAKPALNTWYIFTNAALQGNANMLRNLVNNPTRAAVTVSNLVMLGYVSAALARAFGGDDEERGQDRFDNIPDYDKTANIFFFNPDGLGKYIKSPLAYGFNVFFSAGVRMEDAVNGRSKPSDVVGGIMVDALNAFNPIGGSGIKSGTAGVLTSITPTMVRPLAEITANADFSGRPIYREQMGRLQAPDAETAFESTPEAWRDAAKYVNQMTGGDEFESGGVDVSPDTMRYLSGYYLSGMGRNLDRIYTAIKEPNTQISDIPLLRSFVGDAANDKRSVSQQYYEIVNATAPTSMRMREIENPTSEQRYKSAMQGLDPQSVAITQAVEETEKNLRELRQVAKTATPAQKEAIAEARRKLQARVIKERNRLDSESKQD